MELRLKSAAFENGGTIPRLYTCEGKNLSPPLFWSGAPQGTQTFALLVDDPDAPGKSFLHWLVFDLPAAAAALPEGVPPHPVIEGGGAQGRNDFGDLGYGGPCPPSGTHSYVFTLYAVAGKLDLAPRATREEFSKSLQGRTLGQARLVGRYARATRPTRS